MTHDEWMVLISRMDAQMIRLGKTLGSRMPDCVCGHHLQADGRCIVCMREPELCPCEFGHGPPAGSINHSVCCKQTTATHD